MKLPIETPPPSAANTNGMFWLVALLVIAGILTAGQAEKHGWDNVIGNALDWVRYQAGR